MPIINITQKDINRMQQPEKGWHLAELTSVEEKASKDKASINWNFEFEIKNGGSEGRFAYAGVNSKAPMIVLGPMSSALNNIPLNEVQPGNLDTDKLIGKKCWIEIIEEMYDGKIVKKIKDFATETSRPPF